MLDTKHTAYKEVTAIRNKAVNYWRSLTLPFPEPGIPLIRRHEVDGFNRQMQDFRTELDDAVVRLDQHYAEMKEAARQRLGKLFDANPCDGFEELLKEIAPFLAEPLTVQSIGAENCRFPLAACEWHVRPGSIETDHLPDAGAAAQQQH